MNDILKLLEEKAREQNRIREERLASYISISEITKLGQVTARLYRAEFKNDSRGHECFYITLELKDGKRVVQKYTKTLLPYLYASFLAFRELAEKKGLPNEIEYLQKNYVTWRAEYHHRGYPRLYPTP